MSKGWDEFLTDHSIREERRQSWRASVVERKEEGGNVRDVGEEK